MEDICAARLPDTPHPLKLQATATYHNVSNERLPVYLKEFRFRFNNPKEADIFGKAIGGC